MFGLGEFFYLNKLRPDFFSWNISVFKVYECGKLYFFCFYLSQNTSRLFIFIKYIIKQWNVKNLADVCTQCDVEMPIKNFAIKLVVSLSNLECKYKASEACKTTLNFLEKIPAHVIVLCRTGQSTQSVMTIFHLHLNINVVIDECIINSSFL